MNAWICLLFAISSEVAGTSCMKLSHGLTRLAPSLGMFVFYFCSIVSLTFALKRIDISVAYAIWSGLGTAGLTVIGAICFKEPLLAAKLVSVSLIILGVVGLNLSGGSH